MFKFKTNYKIQHYRACEYSHLHSKCTACDHAYYKVINPRRVFAILPVGQFLNL